jgi:hypothetical protein
MCKKDENQKMPGLGYRSLLFYILKKLIIKFNSHVVGIFNLLINFKHSPHGVSCMDNNYTKLFYIYDINDVTTK